MSEIEDDFAEEACVLFNLGWIDEQEQKQNILNKIKLKFGLFFDFTVWTNPTV